MCINKQINDNVIFFCLFQADQTYIEFGDVVVGSSSCKTLTISNESTCSLQYKLFIEQTMNGPYPDELTKDDKIGMLISNYHCCL